MTSLISSDFLPVLDFLLFNLLSSNDLFFFFFGVFFCAKALVVSLSVGSAEENARVEDDNVDVEIDEDDEEEPEDILAPLMRAEINGTLVEKLMEIQENVPTVSFD